ncbi:MAG TPA: YggT family protein [Chloroflexota bacterium]
MTDVLATFISILGTVLWVAIFIRAILSWVAPQGGNAVSRVLVDITEPVLAPIRRILPPLGGFDLSPIVAIILIQVVSSALVNLVQSSA